MKGESVMTKKIFTMAIALFLTTTILCGCGKEPTLLVDTGITNDIQYENTDFWNKPNELRLVIDYKANTLDTKQPEFEPAGDEITIPSSALSTISKLKAGIKKYFIDNYGIDLSEKLAKQKLKVFSTLTADNGSTTMGYVDTENRNILNLNGVLFSNEYSYLLENTFTHETLHQMGIINQNDGILTEGMTDAFTDLVLCSMGRESVTTPYYFDARTLCYQLIAVDKELPHLYFETKGFSLIKRITEKLEGIPQTLEPSKNIGQKLKDITAVLYTYELGTVASGNDPVYYAYDAQDIVRSYLQTFNPSEEQISYIRHHYLVPDYESYQFKQSANGYEQI
jgi:hypothetical protein